jgi:hypothetical protein
MEGYMENEEWIMRLISQYLESVRILSRRLCQAFNLDDLLSGRRSRQIPRTGVVANGLEFSFHGIGCRIEDGTLSVDFDFMPGGKSGGFDAWRLHLFSEENPSIVGVWSEKEVRAALERLEAQGLIQRVERSSLYRLCAKIASK